WQDGKVAPGLEQHSTDFEASRTLATVNPDTGALSATGVILPGWTNDVTEVRGGITGGADSSHFQITQGANGFLDNQHRFHVGLEWKPRAWTVDLVAAYSRSRVDLRGGERRPASALQMVATVRGVGWRIDKSKSAEFPEVIQTGGPDVTDLSNYEDGHVVKYYGGRDASVSTAALNIKRIQRLGIPVEFGAGGVLLRSKIAEIGGQTRWYYAGLDGARDTGDEDLSVFRDPNFQRDTRFHDPYAPAFNMTAIGQSLARHPGRWVEDIYYRESERLQDTRDVREDIYAGYLMAKTVIGRAGILAGVRYEKTDVWGTGHEKVGSYPNITDPHERLAAEFRDRVTHRGAYEHFFPSVHIKYAITPNLLARASWSTAIGRPEPTNLIPQFAPNISERTLTIDNPGLGPQYANNFDVSLEYYFEPIGVFGISEFRKNIKNFIYLDTGSIIGHGPDNGYDGMYEGYELRRNMNGGKASVEGIELAWQQQLSIITDALKGASIYANYTYLRTKGNYGTGEQRGTGAVAGFIPRAANLGLRYNYRDFGCRLSMIHTGSYLDGFATNLSRRRYIRGRTTWNAGITWRFSRQFRLFIDFNNLTDVPIEYYRGKESRPSTTVYGGPNINMGVNGLF
ncbi:MAG: TonB-dependent receptor, partial [Opitutaceae bacterium]|nr:TonB-dependent receptor [Opitutaceae bacterium]